jgi:hypothetical protein
MDFAQRWLLMLAIAIAIFAICLLLLRVNILTLAILMGIGLSLVTLWMYMDARYFSASGRNVQSKQACACPVCKHQYMQACVYKRNVHACCLITTGEKVVGHLSSTLQ